MNEKVKQEKEDPVQQRVTRVENEIRQLLSIQNQQGENIAAMATAIDNQTKQIGSLLHKAGRPFPIASIVAGIGVLITVGSLALAPLYRGLDRAERNQIADVEHRIESAKLMSKNSNDIEWIKKMEDRVNSRLHAAIIGHE